MPGTNLTREEAATRAALLDVTSYTIDLDLTAGTVEKHTGTFGSTTTIAFTCREPGAETFADLVGATVHQITLNGEDLDLSAYADHRIALRGLAADNVLVVRADCTYSHTGEGLHRFVDPADDRVYLYSQFEVPDARRVFATFEQPDLKAPFTFRVTAPSHWKVVSNAPTPEPVAVEGQPDASFWDFPATKPLSTYVTAVVAGEYHEVQDVYEGRHGTIPLGHYCRQSLVEHLDRDVLVDLTRRSFAFFEEQFAFPYPFEKYDQLYVPEYNMGAMENAGCVTLRDEYLPRSRQPRSFYEFRCSVITHEMAHMWFGDLVTMRWWDDLWLNESFAEWACYWCEAEATEFTDAWTGFANARKQTGYRADQLPTTHPIAADNYDLEAVEVNFDMITYAKGASVLKQLVAWVGLEPFLQGLRQYFQDHAYGNSEFGDLLSALEKSSGRDLGPWAQEWLQTAGVNTLSAEVEVADDGTFSAFAIRQGASAEQPTLRRHRLGIGWYDDHDGRIVRTDYLEIDVHGELTDVPEAVGRRRPDLLLLNDGDLAYAKIRLDEHSLTTATAGLSRLDDSLARALVWGAAWDMTRDGEMAATAYVALVLGNIGTESDPWGMSRIPVVCRPGRRPVLRARDPRRPRRDVGAGAAQAARQRGARQRLPADLRAGLRPRRPQRAGGVRPGGPARGCPRLRGPRGRHRPALVAGHRARPARPGRRRPDRGGARPRRDDLGPPVRRRCPRGHADGRRQGRGLAAGDARPRDPQRDPPQHRAVVHALRPGGGAGAVRRGLPRRRGAHLGGAGRPQGGRRAGAHLPAGAGQPGPARARRDLARDRHGQPRSPALRARGCSRGGPRAHRPGEGRPAVATGRSATGRRLLAGVEGLGRAGVVGEHLDAAAQAADEVTEGEGALHVGDRELDLGVGEVAAYVAAGHDLHDAGVGVDQDQDAPRRRDQRVVQAGRELAGLALDAAHEHRELGTGQLLGLAHRLVEREALAAAEGVTSGHLLHPPWIPRSQGPPAHRRCGGVRRATGPRPGSCREPPARRA